MANPGHLISIHDLPILFENGLPVQELRRRDGLEQLTLGIVSKDIPLHELDYPK